MMGKDFIVPFDIKAKECCIVSYINSQYMGCACDLDDSITNWSQGLTPGKYVGFSGNNFVALKSGKYILKNRLMSIEKYCFEGETIGTFNTNYADIWICIAL